jgi:hypothetical protein
VAISTLINPVNAWHPAMVGNSYLNDHICGYGTPRICPEGQRSARSPDPPTKDRGEDSVAASQSETKKWMPLIN